MKHRQKEPALLIRVHPCFIRGSLMSHLRAIFDFKQAENRYILNWSVGISRTFPSFHGWCLVAKSHAKERRSVQRQSGESIALLELSVESLGLSVPASARDISILGIGLLADRELAA